MSCKNCNCGCNIKKDKQEPTPKEIAQAAYETMQRISALNQKLREMGLSVDFKVPTDEESE